jgi:uncharacterized membrane protein YciS (DUF1049 family)
MTMLTICSGLAVGIIIIGWLFVPYQEREYIAELEKMLREKKNRIDELAMENYKLRRSLKLAEKTLSKIDIKP